MSTEYPISLWKPIQWKFLNTKPCTSDSNKMKMKFNLISIQYIIGVQSTGTCLYLCMLYCQEDNNRKGEIDDEDDIELNSPILADDWFKIFEELQDETLEEPLYETSRQSVPKDVHNLNYSNGAEYRDAHPYPDSNNPNMEQEKLSETRNIKKLR